MKKRGLFIGAGIALTFLCLCGFLIDIFGPEEAPSPKPTAIPTIAIMPTPTIGPPTATRLPRPTATPKPTPTPKATPPTEVYEWRSVEIGTPADDVLERWGKPLTSRKVGEDFKGAVVEWVYEDVVVTTVRWELGGITCYRVWEMRLR